MTLSLLSTAFSTKWLLSFLCSEPFGFHRVFLQLCHCGWTHEAAAMAQKRWFLYAWACFDVSDIMVVIFNTLFLGSRLLPSILEPAPCTLAGVQVAGPWD